MLGWLRSGPTEQQNRMFPMEVARRQSALATARGYRKRNAMVVETFELASRVMGHCELLLPVDPTFADQVLRSGTSVGSHVREAQGAQGLRAFINKMKVAHQELEETDYRLDLCHTKPHYPHDQELVRRTKALFPLINAILKTSIERQRNEGRTRRSTRTGNDE